MTTAKVDFKREHRDLYSAPADPVLIDVPELSFLMVDGRGDPNTAPEYTQAIEALYAVSYALKFALRSGPDAIDYVVMPLEGLWWAPDMGSFTSGDRSAWEWTAMIGQPPQATAEIVSEAVRAAADKKPLPAAPRLRLARLTEGACAQVMYVGPYSAEAPTILRLQEYIAAAGREPHGKHHEIYLSDPRRVAPEKLRTIIRQPVRHAAAGPP